MRTIGFLSLLIFAFLPFSCGLYIDGCPLYGCRPSGTFAYQLNVPNNATVAWVSNFFVGPLPKGQGCVGNLENLVCQSNGPGPLDVGYVAIDADGGFQLWRNGFLHFPTLPVMDSSGAVFGTDGESMTLNDADGHLEPVIYLKPTMRPVFNMEIADEDFLLVVSEQGGIAARLTDGIPVSFIFLNGTEGSVNGTFKPIATPAINGSRAYILTQFVPEAGQEVKSSILEMRRLYAIDMYHRMADRLTVAWYFNLMNLSQTDQKLTFGTKLKKEDRLKGTLKDDTMDYSLLYDYQTGTVFVGLPPPVESSSGRTEGQSTGTFWGIKDTGNNADLVFKKFMPISSMAKYEANDDRSEKLNIHGDMGNSRNFLKPGTSRGNLWAAAPRGVIYGFNPTNGQLTKTINITEALNAVSATITSKLMVARRNDTSSDILIFGIAVTESIPDFREYMASIGVSDLSTLNFLVAYDTSMIVDKVIWMIPTPQNTEINGQIVGIPRSATTHQTSRHHSNMDQRDLLVAFTQIEGKFSKFFAVH
ncbi:hypothetical protein ACJMK2_026206 [Sinanodonta woodiana]|uniref:Uncharacterized protein n=1 Tax=Sinanodonta woodiana TaxID=1069815 RepID=A0ABD3XJE1_SINWO